MSSIDASGQKSGFPAAIAAYLIWGFLPLYLLLVRTVPPTEFVGWRIIFTLPICLLIIALRGQWPEIRRAIADRRAMLMLGCSALLIGCLLYTSPSPRD